MKGKEEGRDIQTPTHEAPSCLLNMVQIAAVPRVRIAVASGVDAAPRELVRFRRGELPAVPLVEDAVGVRAARAHGEKVALEARAIGVDIVYGRALRWIEIITRLDQ